MEWKGADPGLTGCKISFKGRDTSDYSKEYKVCVESEEFYLQSSGIRLKYLTDYNSYADKVRQVLVTSTLYIVEYYCTV